MTLVAISIVLLTSIAVVAFVASACLEPPDDLRWLSMLVAVPIDCDQVVPPLPPDVWADIEQMLPPS
jgi:hypothetical protein